MNSSNLLRGIAGIVILILICHAAGAATTGAISDKTLGFGIQGLPFPLFGPSALYNVSPEVAIQGVFRFGIDVDFYALRCLYRVKTRPQYTFYLNGMLGQFTDSKVTRSIFGPEETDKALGYGLGAGFEYFFAAIPSFGWNLELDYFHIGFKDIWYTYDYKAPSLIMLGLGIHYYIK